MELKDINGKLEELKSVIETERKSFADELKNTTTKTASEFKEEQVKMQSDIDRLSGELDAAVKASNRKGVAGNGQNLSEKDQAFRDYVKKGIESDQLVKAMNTGTSADGGYLISENLDAQIGKALDNVSVMRNEARVMTIPNRNWQKNFRTGAAESSWVGETDARPNTDTPSIVRITGTYGEVYSNPEATQSMLNEGDWDVESYLADEVAREFGLAEELAFWTGDGVNKPKGILTAPTAATADNVRPFGTFQEISEDVSVESLENLMASMKTGYRSASKFYMNRNTQAYIRHLTYADDSPVVRLGADGFSIGGFDIVTADDMPDINSGANVVAFGDMASAFYVLDVNGVTMIRDPYSNKPNVGFYHAKTVGSAIVDSTALKFINTP